MRDNPVLRLALVDDQPLLARGLELLLPAATADRMQLVGTTADAADAAALVRRCVPDLVLVDLDLPAPGGVRAIAAIRRTTPRMRVVALSAPGAVETALAALSAGADGCLGKSSEVEELLPALRAVLDGWAVLSRELLTPLTAPMRRAGPATPNLDAGERRLLRLIAAGCTTVELAEELHCSERTVKRATAALLRKLRVASRTEAAALAGHAGLLTDR